MKIKNEQTVDEASESADLKTCLQFVSDDVLLW